MRGADGRGSGEAPRDRGGGQLRGVAGRAGRRGAGRGLGPRARHGIRGPGGGTGQPAVGEPPQRARRQRRRFRQGGGRQPGRKDRLRHRGQLLPGASGADYATVAYDAATGAQRWASRYNGPAHRDDFALSVAVSPDGATVFVTGASFGGLNRACRHRSDYATVAYDAATGAQRWARRYNGPANSADRASSVAVSPGGATVFVTGTSGGNYATVAYAAATGARRWVSRYNGPANGADQASSVAVSPGGATVFVTGTSGGGPRARTTPRSPTTPPPAPGGGPAATTPAPTAMTAPAH